MPNVVLLLRPTVLFLPQENNAWQRENKAALLFGQVDRYFVYLLFVQAVPGFLQILKLCGKQGFDWY